MFAFRLLPRIGFVSLLRNEKSSPAEVAARATLATKHALQSEAFTDTASLMRLRCVLLAYAEENMLAQDWDMAEAALDMIPTNGKAKPTVQDDLLAQLAALPQHGFVIVAAAQNSVDTRSLHKKVLADFDAVCAVLNDSLYTQIEELDVHTSLSAIEGLGAWYQGATSEFLTCFLWKGFDQTCTYAYEAIFTDITKILLKSVAKPLVKLLHATVKELGSAFDLACQLLLLPALKCLHEQRRLGRGRSISGQPLASEQQARMFIFFEQATVPSGLGLCV